MRCKDYNMEAAQNLIRPPWPAARNGTSLIGTHFRTLTTRMAAISTPTTPIITTSPADTIAWCVAIAAASSEVTQTESG